MSSSKNSSKNKQLMIVLFVVFLDILGFGIIIPIIRDITIFLNENTGLKLGNALLSGILMSSYSFTQFLSAPIIGRLSDLKGRKKLLVYSVAGNVISYFLWAVSQNYWFFLFSRVISGITGGNISVAQSCIADVTSKKDRAKAMGLFGATLGFGFVVGPFLGAYLSTWDISNGVTGLWNPYAVVGLGCMILSLSNLILIIFVLKESAPQAADEKKIENNQSIWQDIFSADSLKGLWKISLKSIPIKTRRFILISFLFSLAFVSLEATIAWDLLIKFNLSAQETGFYFAAMGLLLVIVQGGVYRPLQKHISLEKLIQFGLILVGLFLILYPTAFTSKLYILYLGMITFGLGIINPSLSAAISLETDETEQGLYLGLMHSLSALSRAIMPAAATFIYEYISPLGASWLGAFFVLIALSISTKKILTK